MDIITKLAPILYPVKAEKIKHTVTFTNPPEQKNNHSTADQMQDGYATPPSPSECPQDRSAARGERPTPPASPEPAIQIPNTQFPISHSHSSPKKTRKPAPGKQFTKQQQSKDMPEEHTPRGAWRRAEELSRLGYPPEFC
jgi:hypothetical protein